MGMRESTMTHDELLAEIDKQHWHLFNFHWEDQSEEASEFRHAVNKLTRERRAVVELHKPIQDSSGWWHCNECDHIGDFGCPTIQAIEKELG